MVETPERRRVARLTVPRHLRGGELELHLVHVLDLSPLGARIAHVEPMRVEVVRYVDLPPSLGRIRLTGRVVWTRLCGTERTVDGTRRHHYQSGIEFTGLTPAQEIGLAAALQKLAAANDSLKPDGADQHG